VRVNEVMGLSARTLDIYNSKIIAILFFD